MTPGLIEVCVQSDQFCNACTPKRTLKDDVAILKAEAVKRGA